MLEGEKSLLIATRDRIREQGQYKDYECEIEFDDQAPAVASDLYVVVTTGGWQPGPRHATAKGVNDLVYSVNVTIVRKAGATPRDRRRNIFFRNLSSLTVEIDKVYTAIDWNLDLMKLANDLIRTATGSTQGFIHPLVFSGMDRQPRIVPGEFFGGTGESVAGLARTITFSSARRMTLK